MVAVCDEQLQLERLEVAARVGVGAEAAQHDKQRVDLTQVPELSLARARNVLHADRRRSDLLRVHDLRERGEALVGDRRHADVRLPVFASARLGQRREERRLPAA